MYPHVADVVGRLKAAVVTAAPGRRVDAFHIFTSDLLASGEEGGAG